MKSYKKTSVIAILILLIFSMLPLVSSAVPSNPLTQSTSNGMIIDFPKYYYMKQGQDFRFHVHVINATSSKTNITTSCIIHVYNQTGFDILAITPAMEFESYNGVDFAKTVNGNNFSVIGRYSYVIQCNSSNEIAFASSDFLVTQNGAEQSWNTFIFEPGLLLMITILFLVTAITFNNNRWLVKSSLFLLALLFLTMTINSSLGFVGNAGGSKILLTALVVAVSSVSLLFIVMIVLYLRALARAINQVKSEKKEDLL